MRRPRGPALRRAAARRPALRRRVQPAGPLPRGGRQDAAPADPVLTGRRTAARRRCLMTKAPQVGTTWMWWRLIGPTLAAVLRRPAGSGRYPWSVFSPQGPSLRELCIQALSSVDRGYDLLAPKFDHTPFRTPDGFLAATADTLSDLGPFDHGLDVCCGTGAGMLVLRSVCTAAAGLGPALGHARLRPDHAGTQCRVAAPVRHVLPHQPTARSPRQPDSGWLHRDDRRLDRPGPAPGRQLTVPTDPRAKAGRPSLMPPVASSGLPALRLGVTPVASEPGHTGEVYPWERPGWDDSDIDNGPASSAGTSAEDRGCAGSHRLRAPPPTLGYPAGQWPHRRNRTGPADRCVERSDDLVAGHGRARPDRSLTPGAGVRNLAVPDRTQADYPARRTCR